MTIHSPNERPNVASVYQQLKDFQRDTVEYVFQRMYLDADPAHRFLVADEVGLGKTMVARGVIARALDHLWDRSGRLDVIYICSNAAIARQNISRLNVFGHRETAIATRLTLLPPRLGKLNGQRVNFVSFTPSTSFDLKSNMGRSDERALLYYLLKKVWDFGDAKASRYLLAGHRNPDDFNREIDSFLANTAPLIGSEFIAQFSSKVNTRTSSKRSTNSNSLRARFEELLPAFARSNSKPDQQARGDRQRLIGDLRRALAHTCIHSLKPDLVILDEFQRFSHLLSTDTQDDAALLARELFEYEASNERTRVLLLSATPYKMYGLTEDEGESHYSEFVNTIRFLQDDSVETARLEDRFLALRRLLLQGEGTGANVRALRQEVQLGLRRIMVRTERLAVTADRSGMLREIIATTPSLEVGDTLGHVAGQRLADAVHEPDVMELWKSSPWLLSFMDTYQFKKKVKEAVELSPVSGQVASILRDALKRALPVTLPDSLIDASSPAEVPHPRMRWLIGDTTSVGAWRMLWIPPALPYYKLEGAFADPVLRRFTKRLIFSAWKVVPKGIAAIVSAEAEFGMLRAERKSDESRDDMLKRIRGLLRFAKSAGRLTGMPTLALTYPSPTLASLGDPLRLAREFGTSVSTATLRDILTRCQESLSAKLKAIMPLQHAVGTHDESWYWAAPLLMDLAADRARALAWLSRPDLAARWIGNAASSVGSNARAAVPEKDADSDSSDDDDDTRWVDHVDYFRKAAVAGFITELGPPPADLIEVLSELAVAGPANCALRALARNDEQSLLTSHEFRDAAGSIAHGMRGLFNLPEVVPLLRNEAPGGAYWQVVLRYAAHGGLQSVLDEYVHVLRESESTQDIAHEDAAQQLAARIREALGARTSRLQVDQVRVAGNNRVSLEPRTMRARFAMRFGNENDDDARVTRAETVRTAFNSPFWPFVLASTSVGQEGLDFHQYCHAVVHWNVPSNPVDMEQREGRVHRYKGHAVRRNVAQAHGDSALRFKGDPWEAMFDAARTARAPESSDLVPYWVYPVDGGAVIERHVPNIALSRDVGRFIKLKQMLSIYRMAIGHPRQEELVEMLSRDLVQTEKVYADTLLDLSPPKCAEN